MKALGIISIGVGLFILFGALGIIPLAFWHIILWLIAFGLGFSGIKNMWRKGFPEGLTSLFAGVILSLILLKVIDLGFWGFLASIAGMWLVQQGIKLLIARRRFFT